MNTNTELDNKIELNNIVIFIISSIFVIYVLVDRTIFMNLKIAFPAYIIMLFSIVFLIAYLSKIGISKSKTNAVLFFIIIYMVFLVIYSIYTDISDLNYAVRILVYFSIVFLFSNLNIKLNQFKFLLFPFSLLTLFIFSNWLTTLEMFKYSGFFQNPNTLGIIVFNLMFIHLLYFYKTQNKFYKITLFLFVILNLFLLYLSTSRAVWLALIVSIIVYLLYQQLTKNRLIYRFSFITTLFIILLFSYFYPRLYTMDLGWKINELVIKYTGKSFFTGREALWSEIILMIEKRFFWGYGLSTSSKELIGTNHEAHNMYLNIMLQTGIVGLILYSILLFVIWDSLYFKIDKTTKENKVYKLFPAFMAGLIIYQGFELSFVRGSYSTSLLEWLFLAIGLGFINYKRQ